MEKVKFTNFESYEIGNITYQVISVFSDSSNTLKEKIYNLLNSEVKENCTIANKD